MQLDRIENNPRTCGMVDDSAIHHFARQNRLRLEWRTWKDGTHWHASVKAWKGAEVVGWYGSSIISTEQDALDAALRHLARGLEKTGEGVRPFDGLADRF